MSTETLKSVTSIDFNIKRMIMMLFIMMATCIGSVYALPTPKDVSNAVETKNYMLAEQLLRQILVEKPDNARVHYNLGQVLAFQHRDADALKEMKRAQELDPSLKFAASERTFKTIYAEIQLKAEPSARVTLKVNPPPSQHTTTASIQQPVQQPVQRESGGGMAVFWIIVLIILIGSGAVFGYKLYMTNKQKREEREKLQKLNADTLKTALEYSEKTKNLQLMIRASKHSESARNDFLERLDRIKQKLITTIGQLRADDVEIENAREFQDAIETQGRHLSSLETDVAKSPVTKEAVQETRYNHEASKPKINERTKPKKEAKDYYDHDDEDYDDRVQLPRHHTNTYRNSQPTVVRETPVAAPPPVVVVRDSGSSDLLTGVMIGSMMNSNNHHSPAPAPAPVSKSNFDSGRDDTSFSFDSGRDTSSTSSRSSSSYDSGSSSSSSWDSGSSGGSDSSGSWD